MHRRTFNTSLLLAGLAAPALADPDADDGPPDLPPYDRVRLRLQATTTVVNWFVLMAESGSYGVDLRIEVPQAPARRLDLGRIPLLGQLLTPTLPRQFANAAPVGTLHLVDKMIVLLPQIAVASTRRHVWITHRDILYRPPASLRPLRMAAPLTPGAVRAAPAIGKAVLKNDVILGIVSPSALDQMHFG